jgi:two-component system CheB/CheR fusion protein
MGGKPEAIPLLVVGIGASAGGVEALKEFFAAMPPESRMAFVVVQHLEPTHDSQMAEILARCTSMKVVQAESGMLVEPDRVYTNPAGRYLEISGGRLTLTPRAADERVRMPIDFFLSSLAEDQGETAACIILSGSSGADGTQGVRAVRGAGGFCLAQSPETAIFPAMPQSAIETGLVDRVLPVAQLPAALLGYSKHRLHPVAGAAADEITTEQLDQVLKLLRTRTNSEYRHYRKPTIVRRIHRRMAIKQSATMPAYLQLIEHDQAELSLLSRDILIGVSSFFRDPDAFETLRSSVIEPLVARAGPDSTLRAWVAGCATGEEAYSVAMLMLDAVAAAGATCRVQVFASDVDDRSLQFARAGVYHESIEEAVPAERLGRFFSRRGDKYCVEKRLRESVVFSRHDLIADPPFSKLDLICCRNVLIYIEPAVQRRIISLFGFALNPGGFLFLGKSEGAGEVDDLFEPISKPNRIYRLIRSGRRAISSFPLYTAGRMVGVTERRQAAPTSVGALGQANQEVLLRHFAAAVALVDERGQVLHLMGQTERFLSLPKGTASLNILDMTTGTLSVKLRRAIEKVLADEQEVRIPSVPVPRDGAPEANLTVMLVPGTPHGEKLLAVIFEEVRHAPAPSAPPAGPTAEDPLVSQLEQEVKSLRGELREDADEFEAAADELKAANEEVMSMNEELQSTNEELEASKEELQSLNEELTTVNSQLSDRLSDLTANNNDLANLLGATEIATVFLDSQLRIKRFTPRATDLLNLIPADIGRPIGHITQNFDGKELAADSQKLLRTLAVIEREVQSHDGRWHTMRVLPYRTLDDRIEGVVITFTDVTRLKHAESERRELERRVQHSQKLESLGVLAGGIAHDFNNILTALLGYTDLALIQLADTSRARALLEESRKCALRASELTGQMLAYSGKGTFTLRPVDLNSVIHDMSALLNASISKNVTIEYLLGAICVTTASVPAGSGRAATPPDADLLPDSDYVLLEVRDTGCGMDEATKAKIFDPFFSTKFTGRGLGLSVVAGIIKSHRGSISVESTPGQGTTFRVLLPVDRSLATAPDAAQVVRDPSAPAGGMILVIDDEASVRAVAAAFLEWSGFSVAAAAGGAEGMELFKLHRSEIAAVLLDVMMPGMSTEDVVKELRAIRPDIVILLCSGYSEHEIAARFAGKGISGFIAKPFTMTMLALAISRCIRTAKLSRRPG